MTMTVAGTGGILITRLLDGSVLRSEPGWVWVLRRELTRLVHQPGKPSGEHLTIGVFWSKEMARAFVEHEYGYGAGEWVEGDPDGGFDCIIAGDGAEELIISPDRTPLIVVPSR